MYIVRIHISDYMAVSAIYQTLALYDMYSISDRVWL